MSDLVVCDVREVCGEAPKTSKQSREAAMPHPWEAWSTPGSES